MKKNLSLLIVFLCSLVIFGIENQLNIFQKITEKYESISSSKETETKLIHQNKKLFLKKLETTPASITWPLITDIISKSLEGNLESTISYPKEKVDFQLNTKIDFTGDSTPDSNIIFWETKDGKNDWTPTNDSKNYNPQVYIQFDVNPTNNGTLTISKIEGLVGASGTGNMYYQGFYSLNEDFSEAVQFQTATKLPNNGSSIMSYNFPSPLIISSNQKLYVRFYPYLIAAATNKQFGLRNIKISGTMEGSVATPAIVSTSSVVSISTTSAISGGNISSNGGGEITSSGVVWSTIENPTILNNKTNENVKSGSFTSNLSDLTPATTYYLRAYATNKAGTSYGNQIVFKTLETISRPTITTTSQSQVTNKSFVVSGNVTDWGGSEVFDRGIVYSKTTDPSIDNAIKVSTGSGLGAFSSYVHGVESSTTYYVKTFAINSAGISYGEQITVSTKATQSDVIKTIAKDGSGDYLTVQAAFDAVPDNYTGRWILHIKPGTYIERPTLLANKINVYLIGDDANTTIITNNISAGTINPDTGLAYGTSMSQTMAILANDFTASKITIENTFVNSFENTQINPATQAVALKTQGDRQAFYNCRILGYQDTYLGNSIGRAYFKNSYIEGNVDFIFGRQTVVFDQSTTYINRNNSVIVAPSTEASTKFGFVFLDCKLKVPPTGTIDFNGTIINNFHFGRAWQNNPKAAFIRCETPEMLNSDGWTTPINGTLPVTFVEYGNTGLGSTPEKLALRGNGGVVLSSEESSIYTISNVFKKETDPSFVFDWLPESEINIDFEPLKTTDILKDKKVLTYPNPFSNLLTIVYDLKSDSDVSIAFFDSTGKMIFKDNRLNQKTGRNEWPINTTNFKTGIYFYVIKSNSMQSSGKVIKK